MVKLICSAKDIPYEVVDVDFQNMKTDRVAYPFGQCECADKSLLASRDVPGLVPAAQQPTGPHLWQVSLHTVIVRGVLFPH